MFTSIHEAFIYINNNFRNDAKLYYVQFSLFLADLGKFVKLGRPATKDYDKPQLTSDVPVWTRLSAHVSTRPPPPQLSS